MFDFQVDIKSVKREFEAVIPKRQIFDRYIDRLSKGGDASLYRMIPKLVIQVNNESEVISVLKKCNEKAICYTFKAGGTSLCGQSVTEELLIEVGPEYNRYDISEDGKIATFDAGVKGGFANMLLAKKGRKLGPSPSSMNSAKVGGIVANNASGASYGIITNSYNTVRSMRIVFYDGSVLDTGSQESRDKFAQSHTKLISEIVKLRGEVIAKDDVVRFIGDKYSLKNTTGYGVNSLVDFEDPIDIIQHLMIGSEGTLGFISQVTFDTFENHSLKTCALLFFTDIREAAKSILPLRECDVSAAELMDRNALRAVEDLDGLPSFLKELDEDVVALLVETSANDSNTLESNQAQIVKAIDGLDLVFPAKFTDNSFDYELYWKVRHGLFTSAAATRDKGTSCIIEDVAFPAENLADALTDMNSLLKEHNYLGAVIWGHLLDGNIHFVIMPNLDDPKGLEIYKKFMHRLAILVVDQYKGSLKGEHGTGRNMAPFVKHEWGDAVYNIMEEIKLIFDPNSIVNMGVLLNSDPEVYYQKLKSLPISHPLIDVCIECGFCERSCPTRDFTLTPRQRTVAYRELTMLNRNGEYKRAKMLEKEYNFKGIESCATDGLCAANCPVGIDTGKMVKDLRFKAITKTGDSIATGLSNRFSPSVSFAKGALNFVYYATYLLPNSVIKPIATGLHKISGRAIPLWNPNLPKGGAAIDTSRNSGSNGKVVYFPACINRIFGVSKDYEEKIGLTEKTRSLLQKAGYEIIYPKNLKKLCCGMAFDSKGYKEQGYSKLKELETALLEVSNGGEYPVLCDMSPCLYRMKSNMDSRLKLYEPVKFTLDHLVDHLLFTKQERSVAVHSTCSNSKMGLDSDIVTLANLCVTDVIKPEKTGCCGWAGDKGFNLPDLNSSALRYLKDELPEDTTEGFSTSRTCEIGLSKNSGLSYKSIIYLVDQVTSAK